MHGTPSCSIVLLAEVQTCVVEVDSLVSVRESLILASAGSLCHSLLLEMYHRHLCLRVRVTLSLHVVCVQIYPFL